MSDNPTQANEPSKMITYTAYGTKVWREELDLNGISHGRCMAECETEDEATMKAINLALAEFCGDPSLLDEERK